MSNKSKVEKNEQEKIEYKNMWENPKTRGRIKTGIFLFVFLIFFIVNNTGNSTEEGPYPPYSKGKNKIDFIAPDFTSQSLNGETIQLSKLKGKVVVLDFFSFRSHYASSSLPMLNSIKNEFGDYIEVIGVSMDRNSPVENVKSFLDKFNLNFPVIVADYNLISRFKLIYGDKERKNIINPATIIIDQEGHIFSKYGGQLKKETYLSDLKQLIKQE